MPPQPRLQIKVSQKLVLTPALQQAIKLLPMTTVELAEMLNQEMSSNPMLEEVPIEEDQAAESADQQEKPTESETWTDEDLRNFFGEYLDQGSRQRPFPEVKDLPPIENALSATVSLTEHLTWQLSLRQVNETTREIAAAIIGNLDTDGRLVASTEEIEAMGSWSVNDVADALEIVQHLDPIGVAARNLQECLLLQLRQMDGACTLAERIVSDHLRLLQEHNVPELARRLGRSVDEIEQQVHIVGDLDPKPGTRYNSLESQYVIPEVFVVKREDEYVAVLNDDELPTLRINSNYRRLLDPKNSASNPEARAFVREKLNSAVWLIKSVQQRQKTIQKVANSLVKFQREFLDLGIEHLHPLILRTVADDIDMHESTVSRVVSNKYMHTPQGLCEMKYFFHSGLSNAHGENISSVTIKERIRKIIKSEDTASPFSDAKMVKILRDEDLILARRTIAKYREELKIPTSHQRKISH